MINKKLENLISDLKGIRMSSKEKTDIYTRALSVIDAREAARISMHTSMHMAKKPVKTTWVNIWNVYIMERKFMPTLVFVAILLTTGGTSIAAENSLPGESLYPLKINVNEQLQALTAFTPEAKAKVASDAANQRLKEAVILSKRGQLNDGTKEILEQQIMKNAGEIKNQVASLVSTNNLKTAQSVTVNFESSLKTHALILAKLSADETLASSSTNSTSTIGSLLVTVKDELATTTVARVGFAALEFRADANNREKIEAILREVKADFADTQKVLQTSSVSTSTASTSFLYFSEASKYIEIATKSMNMVVYPEALTALQHVEQILSDVQALIHADMNLEDQSELTQVVNEALAGAKPEEGGTSVPEVTVVGEVQGAETSTPAEVLPAATSTQAATVATLS